MADPEFKEDFVTEAKEHLATAEEDILALEEGGSSVDTETISRLFRALHTIKGIAGFLNLGKIRDSSHALESVIGKIRDKELEPANGIPELLLRGVDRLNSLVDAPDENDIDISDIITDCENILKPAGPKESKPSKPAPAPSFSFDLLKYDLEKAIKTQLFLFELNLDLVEECTNKKQTPAALIASIKSVGDIWDTSRDISSLKVEKDETGHSAFTVLLATVIEDPEMLTEGLGLSPISILSHSPKQLETLLNSGNKGEAEDPSEYIPVSTPVSKAKKQEDQAADIGEITEKSTPNAPVSAPSKTEPSLSDQTVRISLHLLDKLMNLATELVLVRNQNMQAVHAGDLPQLASISQQLNVVTSDLQASIMQTRMRPVGTIFSRFTRVVRDLAKKLDKKVTLKVHGADVELDKGIIDSISDPMTHLIRNAVDHGLETPDVRESLGKPIEGHIHLSAYHHAGQINIEIRDDGKGMDTEIIKKAAVKKQIITQEQADSLSNHDTLNLIFEPGFSTAEEVTEVSGRGVGMDVVKTSFQKLGGSTDIVSTLGKGTTITIKLPLTLAIMPALIVSVEDYCYAIPQVNILEVVWLHGQDVYQSINRVDDKEIYWLRGRSLPLLRLSNILGIQKTFVSTAKTERVPDPREPKGDRRAPEAAANTDLRNGPPERRTSIDNSLYIIVLQLGNERFGLVVDRVVDTEEIVVKALHDQIKNSMAFSGNAVLGDGHIAMILDIAAIAKLGSLQFINVDSGSSQIFSSGDDQQTILLFDIGAEERFALSLCLITRVQEIHTREIQMANGREYLNFRGNLIPIIRIDQAVPTLKSSYNEDCIYIIIPKTERPIGIAAANILDTREVQCNLDSSTIHQKEIIGSKLIEGRLTLFLDAFAVIEAIEPNWFKKEEQDNLAPIDILLVEDSHFYKNLLGSYLRGMGFNVTIASNGKEALEKLKKQAFSGIISDLEMPVMNGFEFAKKLRQDEDLRHLPLLAISVAEEEIMRPQALDYGFDDFKSKMNLESLLDAIIQSFNV